ncbi:hypothetical protein [Pseudomonas syringae]|uniref:hypothetical protein n=1 Tax=Pseudomonas syringae TaxID=317 RepID=UPI001372E6DE|nr:hypothetical protein [Pseudomonas syringae]NAO51846.1 hypothetical protein [Pseudomonas syringae]
MSYYYSQEARARISALEQQSLTEFVEEVPHSYRKSCYDRLTAIDGFRSGTPTDFKAKQKRLIGHLLHPLGGQKSEAHWKTFANFWVEWARNHLHKDFPAGDKLPPASDAGPLFLVKLFERFPDAPRETVERLIEFSGFADHADTQIELGKFRTASIVARDRLFEALPDRVGTIEDSVESLEATTDVVAEQLNALRLRDDNLAEELGDVRERATESTRDLVELRALAERLLAADEQLTSTVRALEENAVLSGSSAEAAKDNLRSLREAVKLLSDRSGAWDEMAAHLSAIENRLKPITARETVWVETTDAVARLSERLDTLQSSVGSVRNDPLPTSQVRLFEAEPQGPLVEILSVETACDLISTNLQACGFVNGAALTVARQIIAALAAGQLIQFTGSLADVVADALAAAVGGSTYHEWRVPVGLVSDEAAAECLEIVGEISGCLALKGANRSAFEVYGSAIREVITRRQLAMSVYPRLALVASWTQGPAAFPDGGTLAELGPVFDTDVLPMRGVTSRLINVKYGHLAQESWDQLEGFDIGMSGALVAELTVLLEEAGFQPGNLWRRCAERAYLRLRTAAGGSEEWDLYALLTAWALPWAKSTGGPVDDLARLAGQVMAQHQAETSYFEGA